jgi:CBS domain-containing protein
MADQDNLATEAGEINPTLTAADVMTEAPRTCSRFSTVLEAVLLFKDANCGIVPVVDGGKPIGVLTDRDVALALGDYKQALPATPVGDVMTQGVATITQDSALPAVVHMLTDQGLRRLLVVDDAGVLVGIISWANLLPHMSARGLGKMVHHVVEHPH